MNADETLVTIAIPIYNTEKYLRYSIQSVINQTYQNWELLLMEDGSTDSSLVIAKDFELLDSRIKVVSDGVNKGLIYRLNQSIKLASGNYYARMDADDVMAVNRIAEEVKVLNDNPQIDVVGSSTMLIDSSNNISGSRNMKGNNESFIHPSVMGRIEWFRDNNYDSNTFRVEDKDLWFRTAFKSTFYNIEKPLLFYRAFGTSSSIQTFKSNKRQRKLFRKYKLYQKSLYWCMMNTLLSYLRDMVFFFMPLLGGSSVLEKIKKRKPVPESFCLFQSDLEESIKM